MSGTRKCNSCRAITIQEGRTFCSTCESSRFHILDVDQEPVPEEEPDPYYEHYTDELEYMEEEGL